MRYKLFLKIIFYFGILPCLSLFVNQPLEAKVRLCPENVRKEGSVFRSLENDEWTLSITVKEFYKGHKKNYPARLGLAKLEAFEEFISFVLPQEQLKENAGRSFANFPESLKFGKGPDLSWNRIKKSLASMEILEECVTQNEQIVFTAIWDSKNIKILNNQIALDDAFVDLLWYFEDQLDALDELEKNYPNVFSIEDPNVLINIIKKHKKLGKF